MAPRRDAAVGQHGSILVSAAVFILIGLVLLGAVQLGYLYYTQRQLQNAADLAALSGVQSLDPSAAAGDGGCAAAKSVALAIAQANFPGMAASDSTLDCGTWTSGASGAQYSAADPAQPGNTNAVQVQLSHNVASITPFSQDHTLNAVARAATSQPVAAFSVGSRLLSVNDSDGLLAAILKSGGVDPARVTVLDSSGVANLFLTPSGLLQQLGLPASVAAGVGTPDELAELKNLTLGQFLNAAATIVGQSNTDLATAIRLIGNTASFATNPITLFGSGGVIALPGDDPTSALSTSISVVALVEAAVVVANQRQALKLSLTNSLLTSPVTISVLEPPTIVTGGKGASASNMQVRADILLSLLGLSVGLTIRAVQSTGVLSEMCAPPLTGNQARIQVRSELTNAQIIIGPISVSFGVGQSESEILLSAPGSKTVSTPSLGIADVISGLTTAILGRLGGLITAVVLKPLLSPLDPLLTSVLHLLGLDIGQTDVDLYSVQCSAPRLVY